MTRRALTVVVLATALFAAVVIQLTVVNRLPFPGAAGSGSTGPDLVLLLVTAIAVATSPLTGAVTGFAGGLALDIAPPAAHYAGEYALVFCLAGYAAARVHHAVVNMNSGERDLVTAFTVMVAATAAGEAGKAVLGMLLSDPDVTGAATRSVLPGALLYDLLIAPLAFWFVAWVTRATRTWGTAAERAPGPDFSHEQRLASVFRQASAGAVPNLRLAGTGEDHRSPSAPRRVPRLRLSGASSGSSLRTTAASSGGSPFPLAGGRTARLNFAGNPSARTAKRTPRVPGKNWLRAAAGASVAASPARQPLAGGSSLRGSAFTGSSPFLGPSATLAARRAARSPSRGWLRSAGRGRLAGARTGARTSGPPRGFMGAAHSAASPAAARSGRSPADALAARSAPSGLSALSGAGTPLAGHAPRAGWLRTARSAGPGFSARRLSPRNGWLGSSRRPRTVIGSGVGAGGHPLRPRGRGIGGRGIGGRGIGGRGISGKGISGTAGGNWYTGSPSGAWLRRSRHPWRKRSQRLLRMVGVGK
jgi:rod shape-determining protein MreD